MKKIIADLKKNKLWTKNDRIAVIACSNKPYDLSRKQIIKHFIEDKVGKQVNDFPY